MRGLLILILLLAVAYLAAGGFSTATVVADNSAEVFGSNPGVNILVADYEHSPPLTTAVESQSSQLFVNCINLTVITDTSPADVSGYDGAAIRLNYEFVGQNYDDWPSVAAARQCDLAYLVVKREFTDDLSQDWAVLSGNNPIVNRFAGIYPGRRPNTMNKKFV